MTHKQIIEKFKKDKDSNGVEELRLEIGEKYNTVYGWYRRDSIPQTYFKAIVKAGNELDLGITYKMLGEG